MNSEPNFPFFSRVSVKSHDKAAEKGFALIFVLWTLLLLSALGGSILKEARTTRSSAAAATARLNARLVADGAINRAILSLLDTADPLQLPLDGTGRTIKASGESVALKVESENGKIDLNAAPTPLLETLFRGQGIAPADSAVLAARIAAWRASPSDEDRETMNAEYKEAGRSYGPRFAAFKSIGELRLLLGVSPGLESAVEPIVTVWSTGGGIDRAVSSDQMLRYLAAAGDKLADGQLTARQSGNAAGADRRPAPGEVFEIGATVRTADCEVRRTAIVQIIYDPANPFRVFSWR